MIKISVPATSANLGPGFDCMGLALTLYNTFYVEEIDNGLQIEGCSKEFSNEDNLFYVSFMKALKTLGESVNGVRIIFKADLPLKGGLGSSATCVIGGIIAAYMIKNRDIDIDEVLNIAIKIEPHPDNLVPSLLGGMTVSVIDKGTVFYQKLPISESLKFICLSPDMKLSTEESRLILPKKVSLNDAVFNISRAVMMSSALASGDIKKIKLSCKDKLHQYYRGKLIPFFFDIIDYADKNGGICSFLSGAGPSIMVIALKDNNDLYYKIQKRLESEDMKWTVRELYIDNDGTQYGYV